MCGCLFVLQLMCFLSIMVVLGTAGVIVSLSRIFTKLLVEDEKNNTIIFFLFSISIETLCFLLHVVVRQTHFVRYHTDRARHSHSWLKGQINNVTTQKHSGYQIHYDSSAEEEVNSLINILVWIWLLVTFCELWRLLAGFKRLLFVFLTFQEKLFGKKLGVWGVSKTNELPT